MSEKEKKYTRLTEGKMNSFKSIQDVHDYVSILKTKKKTYALQLNQDDLTGRMVRILDEFKQNKPNQDRYIEKK